MLDLRRLRLLHELHARGTIAAVADALQFTPSAVSQQLAVLEREAGVPLLERGRPRRPADRRRARARRPRRGAARAGRASRRPSWPPPRAGSPGAGGSPRSSRSRCGSPSRRCRRSRARRPALRCELVEAEPEQSLPALALGDVDLVLADEWQHQPLARPRRRRPRGPARRPGPPRPARGPSGGPAAPGRGAAGRARRRAVDDRPSRDRLGGDHQPHVPRARRLRPRHPPPDQRQRHQPRRSSPPARPSRCCPSFVRPEAHPGVAVRAIAEGSVHRTIFVATRAADAERPSVQALRAAVRAAAAHET